MRTPPDHAALLDGLHTLVERINDGDAGLPVLTQLLGVAGAALGAAGMSLSEHCRDGGRVVAATGALDWAVGRPLAADRTPPANETWEAEVDPAADEFSAQLRARGLHRLLGTRVRGPDGPDGVLCAYFAEADQVAGPEHHRVLGFAGSCASALYLHADHLPVAVPPPAATEDRDLLLAVASHELRTPVTVIKGFADTVNRHWDTLDPDARREAVRVIGKRADELTRLVDQLLATTVDSTAVLVSAPFNLVDALRDAIGGLPAELRARLRTRLPDTLPPAYGDRATVVPVLTELVTNAAKYSSAEIVVLADADERTVRFRVTDRGEGIAPEHVERAFTRFWQAGPGERGTHPGAGLGLYLVRRIVERQKGWVSLRPRRSGGTVVDIRLLRSDVARSDEN